MTNAAAATPEWPLTVDRTAVDRVNHQARFSNADRTEVRAWLSSIGGDVRCIVVHDETGALVDLEVFCKDAAGRRYIADPPELNLIATEIRADVELVTPVPRQLLAAART